MRWKLFSKQHERQLVREYRYASHHHLIPLYILSGLSLLALMVMGSFVAVLWQNNQQDSWRPSANLAVGSIDSQFIPTALSPSEKKQYVSSAGVRFAIGDPYDNLRYSYDPGRADSTTSSIITFTTSETLQNLARPIVSNPSRMSDYLPRMQQCSRLYVVRFEPGLTPYGGFVPLSDVKLKDGRTAYIHKNASCVPTTTDDMNLQDRVERSLLSIESF